jgi:hypothetical protein
VISMLDGALAAALAVAIYAALSLVRLRVAAMLWRRHDAERLRGNALMMWGFAMLQPVWRAASAWGGIRVLATGGAFTKTER